MGVETLTFVGELTVVTCWCGMRHAIPSELRRHQQREHDNGRSYSVYCPLGHSHVLAGKSTAQQERERADWFARQLANRDEDLRSERASHAATKGQLTKAKKRTAGGACPCCKRTFVQLARHIATKHPDYAAED